MPVISSTSGHPAEPVQILVIEDNNDLAFGLSRSLEAEGYDVLVASDGKSGIALAREHRPAMVILDLMLPGMDGYAALETLRAAGLTMPVLILTARGGETDKVHGLRIGADDYVTKPFSLSEPLARVAAHLRRARADRARPHLESSRFGDVEVNRASHTVTRRGVRVQLTPREYELLIAFLDHPGEVLSRITLLTAVWGHAADIMTRTVDIHVGELRRKLEDTPAEPRHFITVWKTGYRFDP
jgi:two-component system response regulator MtrA